MVLLYEHCPFHSFGYTKVSVYYHMNTVYWDPYKSDMRKRSHSTIEDHNSHNIKQHQNGSVMTVGTSYQLTEYKV